MAKGSKYQHYKEEWVQAYNEGSSLRQIGEKYGVAKATVKRLIQDEIELRAKSPCEAFKTTWISLYENGWSINEIGTKYGFSPTAVSRLLKANGILIRGSQEVGSKYESFLPEMKALYTEGWSLSQIAEKFNCHAQTVHNLFQKENFSLRSYAESSRKYTLNEHYFDSIDSKEKAYWLGFVFATGNLNEQINSHLLTVSFVETLIEHVEHLSFVLGSDKPIMKRSSEERYDLTLNSKHLFNTLENIGLKEEKSKMIFPTLSNTLQKSFLLGYYDGCGSLLFNKEHNRLTISAFSNPSFLVSVATYIKKEISIPFIQRDKQNTLVLYSKQLIHPFLHWLYWDEPVFLPEKRMKFEAFRQTMRKH